MFANWVFQPAVFSRFEKLLEPGERLVGEWLAQAHGTRYDLINREPFAAFDLMRGQERQPWSVLAERVSPYFAIPAVIHIGLPISIEQAMLKLGVGFYGALDPSEGLVYRVERRGKLDFLAKYVRPEKIDGVYLPEMSGQPAIWNWRPPKDKEASMP